jgi:hypothetical protein
MQKKALYVRFKGIPEGVNYLSFNIAKTLINKGLSVIARNEVSLPPHFHEGRLCESNCFFLARLRAQPGCRR